MESKWSDVKQGLLNEDERDELEFAAQLVKEICAQRNKLGLTQRQLAEKAGIKQSALARLESGGVVPRIGTILKLAKALGLKLSITLVEDEQAATRMEHEEFGWTDLHKHDHKWPHQRTNSV